MVDLKAKPYNLNEEGIRWVKETFASMTQEEKLGQIFIQLGRPGDEKQMEEHVLKMHCGGVLFRAGEGAKIREAVCFLQKNSRIPLLVCGNLEEGGSGLASDGTYFSKQMGVAATGDPHYAYLAGKISASEAGALGCCMNFGPVVDMAIDWHSAITNTNSFGSDPDRVYEFAAANMKGLTEGGMAAAVKHYPGEGWDDRDQHYQCEMNGMSMQEWDSSFGSIFQRLIDDGAMAVMPGHIALPSCQKEYNPDFGDKVLPATFSKEILTDLLRGKQGFNGLVISDNTMLSGFSCYLPRAQAVPQMVEAGVDLILYSFDMAEDVRYLEQALEDGRLSRNRLDEAVLRNLAVKAALGMPRKKASGTLVPPESALSELSSGAHLAMAAECADKAVTLVKDTQNLLPIDPAKLHRVYLTLIADPWERSPMAAYLTDALVRRGFEVTLCNNAGPEEGGVEAWKKKYDLLLYAGRIESAHKDKTVLRISWNGNGNPPRMTADIPSMYISFGNPFDLYDVPMMKTYVNAYTGTETVIDAVLDKITGKSSFRGTSPVDPFCGLGYAKY